MDKRKKYIMVLDTETCPIEQLDSVDPNNMLVYDIGYLITDKMGNVYERKSYVVADILFGEMEKMESSYYAEKIPNYLNDIAKGTRKVRTLWEIAWIISNDIERYHVSAVCAHNARFDFWSLRTTEKWLGQTRSTVPYIEWWDTNKMAQVIVQQKSYQKFCKENGYMTNHKTPRPQTKAEVLYKYISGNNDFVESHTGLEDCEIEKEILIRCLRQHKKMEKKLFKGK